MALNARRLPDAGAKPRRAALTLRAPLATLGALRMEIRKALITAAGKNQRTLPLQSLVDRDGVTKTALAIIIEEILRAGIENDRRGHQPRRRSRPIARRRARTRTRLTFIEQPPPLGYAHAIHCAAEFCGSDPFLLLVGDHLYLSATEKGCAQQLVEVARAENCAVSAVQSTHESKLPYYGAVGGKLVNAAQRLYQVDTVLEKPTPTEAEQKLDVPGLRAGYYLCFFGMHVLTPAVQRMLGELLAARQAARRGELSRRARAARRAGALPRLRARRPPLRLRREIRPAHRAARAGALRQGSRRSAARPGGTAGDRQGRASDARIVSLEPVTSIDLITSPDAAIARPLARRALRRGLVRRAARGVRRARCLPATERESLRARARALFPLRDSSLSSAGAAGADAPAG